MEHNNNPTNLSHDRDDSKVRDGCVLRHRLPPAIIDMFDRNMAMAHALDAGEVVTSVAKYISPQCFRHDGTARLQLERIPRQHTMQKHRLTRRAICTIIRDNSINSLPYIDQGIRMRAI